MNEKDRHTTIPRRRRDSGGEEKRRDPFLPVRNILNIIFMLLAVVGVIVYLTKHTDTGIIIVLVAMGFKMIECILRFIK
ncbi:MAG: hypothetical protein J6E45_05725 [Prevotella sp.]|nr:hypothetical protein [Prevotella sp.]